MSDEQEKNSRQIIGVFDNADHMHNTVLALQEAGFRQDDMSLIANEHTINEKLGQFYQKTDDLEKDPSTPKIAYTSPDPTGDAQGALIGTPMYVAAFTAAGVMIAAGGPMAATIAAIVGASGAGAALGGVMTKLFGTQNSDKIQQKLETGGLLLVVRCDTDTTEEKAREILSQQNNADIFSYDPANIRLASS
ncbi:MULTISPECIES: hypothetical protein [Thalassospira]|uniref:General stress protein 17M-like domain-containing protein n=1 Tax=Thalassospira profundimaris TaxID=502049 RepID=A0A367X9P0_9PROT|nr:MULTISPECIES: hypothetical protein [Thalassospira]RCK50364.1 hypothetical protein TH25_12310 [Thalassospira profundimaris]